MIFSNKVYNALKQVAQVWLPATGTLYFALAQIWGLPAAEEISGTVLAVDTFLGVVLGLSTKAYNNSPEKFDGTFELVPDPENGVSSLRLKNVDQMALMTKNEVVFRVNK
jgi:hypothetical protein